MIINKTILTLSWRRPLSYRNQFIDLPSKSMDWFLHDNGLRHERVNLTLRVCSLGLKLQNAGSFTVLFLFFYNIITQNMNKKIN